MMARFAVDVRYSTYRISRVGTRVKLPRKRPAKPHVIFSVIPDHLYPFEGETFVEEADLAAYTARWLQLADAALSATEKAAKTLEIAREEQEHIRREIKRKLENYGKLKRRKAKKVG